MVKFRNVGKTEEELSAEISASTQSKASEGKRISNSDQEISAEISAHDENIEKPTGKKSARKSGISAKKLLARIEALEARIMASGEDIPWDYILDLVELAERIYHISIPVRKRDKKTGQMKVTETYTKSGEMVKLCTRVRTFLGKPITYPWQSQKPEA